MLHKETLVLLQLTKKHNKAFQSEIAAICYLPSFQKSGSVFVPRTVQSAQALSYVIRTKGTGGRNICWINPPGPTIQAVGWVNPDSIIHSDVLRYGI